jgi:hypothetical protein
MSKNKPLVSYKIILIKDNIQVLYYIHPLSSYPYIKSYNYGKIGYITMNLDIY